MKQNLFASEKISELFVLLTDFSLQYFCIAVLVLVYFNQKLQQH